MSNFTKGRWGTVRFTDCYVIFDKDNDLVADCHGSNREANARLIATAPDMYKLLIDLHKANTLKQEAVDKVISKAEELLAHIDGRDE